MENTPKSSNIRGVGDVVAKITDGLGIPKCPSCSKRQDALNAHFPFGDTNGNPLDSIKNSYKSIISKLKSQNH